MTTVLQNINTKKAECNCSRMVCKKQKVEIKADGP